MQLKYLIIILIVLFSTNVKALTATEEKSPNGISYTLINMPNTQQISMQLAWPHDWVYQNSKNQTVPYIGTQLILAGGAEGYSAGEVAETFADLESHGHLNTALGHIYGSLNFKKENLDETVKIANAHLQKPTLNEAWLKRIRNQIKNNLSELNSQQNYKTFGALRWKIMGDSPLRESHSLDSSEEFDAATREDIIQWHQQTITQMPEAIVIAGNIDSNIAGKAIDKLLTGLPKEITEVATTPSRFDFTPKRILLHTPKEKTSQLTFVGRIPPTRLGKEFEDLIIAQALGGGEQSKLFEAVRTQLRASYGYAAGIINYTREDRILLMTGEIETQKIAKAEKLIIKTYNDFLTQGLEGNIDEYKTAYQHQFDHVYKDASLLASSALQSKLDGFDNQRVLNLSGEIQTVSSKTLKERLANAYPQANELIIIASSPDEKALANACVIKTPEQAKDC